LQDYGENKRQKTDSHATQEVERIIHKNAPHTAPGKEHNHPQHTTIYAALRKTNTPQKPTPSSQFGSTSRRLKKKKKNNHQERATTLRTKKQRSKEEEHYEQTRKKQPTRWTHTTSKQPPKGKKKKKERSPDRQKNNNYRPGKYLAKTVHQRGVFPASGGGEGSKTREKKEKTWV